MCVFSMCVQLMNVADALYFAPVCLTVKERPELPGTRYNVGIFTALLYVEVTWKYMMAGSSPAASGLQLRKGERGGASGDEKKRKQDNKCTVEKIFPYICWSVNASPDR